MASMRPECLCSNCPKCWAAWGRMNPEPCPQCGGAGFIVADDGAPIGDCFVCDGSGRLQRPVDNQEDAPWADYHGEEDAPF